MSTSGSYDNRSTMTNIIYDAFAAINAHDPGETLPASKWVHASRVLNQLISFLSIRESLWLRTDVAHTLTPGTESYTIGVGETIDTPLPTRVLAVTKTVSSQDIPIQTIPRVTYRGIPNKSLQSGPLMVYYDKQLDTGVIYVWPTGTSTDKTITLTTSRPIQDFDDEGNNPDLPREWELFLTFLLAEKLAVTYNGGVIPQGVSQQVSTMMMSITNFDCETESIFIQP